MLRLKHEGLTFLHDEFARLLQRKGRLISVQDRLVQFVPDLQNVSDLKEDYYGCYSLWFRDKTRSAVISFYGDNNVPDAVCHWDECALYGFPAADLQTLGAVLKRWICDAAMPSEMRREFPSLSIGKLADYYEAGKPIEGEFIDSWDGIEEFFQWAWPKPRALQFISDLRRAGYDRTFRAGQSLVALILSRSRRHGLRPEQPRICFQFSLSDNEMTTALIIGGEENSYTGAIGLSLVIKAALAKLAEYPID
jgi:hypothetical protein